jgi:hypothetical protein
MARPLEYGRAKRFSLTPQLDEAIRREALLLNCSANEVVRRALVFYFKHCQKRRRSR